MKKSEIKVKNDSGALSFTLFLAFIGAAIYFVGESQGFWGFILAILKAIVWPAYLIHEVFGNLQI